MSRYLGVPARVLLLMLALSIVPAIARADYVYTVTSTISAGLIQPTQFSFTQPTIFGSGDLTSGLTVISGATPTEFLWNSFDPGFCSPFQTCAALKFGGVGFLGDFPAGSFLAPGTYTSLNFGDEFTVNIAQTGVPEPSSLLLLASGILGLLGAVRGKLKA